ncbi:MAG TPA: hypothetical protein VHJ18_23605 [Streptosporangiaceae bacterium]|jgi:hypothetical protein|nr:hypothetical protein [Streptosporangiaceae bacterium]
MVPVSVSTRARVSTASPRGRTHLEVRAADPAVTTASALHAVQVALDRRDNGGDAGSAGDE